MRAAERTTRKQINNIEKKTVKFRFGFCESTFFPPTLCRFYHFGKFQSDGRGFCQVESSEHAPVHIVVPHVVLILLDNGVFLLVFYWSLGEVVVSSGTMFYFTIVYLSRNKTQ